MSQQKMEHRWRHKLFDSKSDTCEASEVEKLKKRFFF